MTSTESLSSASELDTRGSGLRMLSNRFLNDLDGIADRFANASPFKHVLIPELFAPDVLKEVLQHFPRPDEEKMRNEFGVPNRKFVRHDVRDIGPIFRAIDDLIQTAEWSQLMGGITGIKDLLYDAEYFGAGTHENLSGAGMDVHVDFNRHPSTGYHRRINAIIYLNERWQPEWEGALRLHKDPWDFERDWYVEYPPLVNHCVIFETNEKSWHGFERISAPAGISRKSFTIYMYTRERPADEVAARHETIYVQKGPPAFIKSGHTLTESQVAEVKGIFRHRNAYLQAMYGKHSLLLVQNESLFRQNESLLKKAPVPVFGYARQKSIRGNLYHDNLGLGSFIELTCEACKPLKEIVLRGRVPPFLERNTIFLNVAGYPDKTCLAEDVFALTAPVSIAAGETVVLKFGGETARRPPNADVRTYSMFLTGLEFVPA